MNEYEYALDELARACRIQIWRGVEMSDTVLAIVLLVSVLVVLPLCYTIGYHDGTDNGIRKTVDLMNQERREELRKRQGRKR